MTCRPTPDSASRYFGQMLLSVSWSAVYSKDSTTDKVETLDMMLDEMVSIAFPVKSFRKNNFDLPYITAEIKLLARRKKQEYRRHGRSDKYRRMSVTYKEKIKGEAKKYLEKNVSMIKNTNHRK